MSDARVAVLGRIRQALGPQPSVPDVVRGYRLAGDVAADVELFCERVAEYRATVHRVEAAEFEATLGRVASGLVAVPTGVQWLPAGLDVAIDDPPLSPAALDELDGVLTGCAFAIAETGTIVLDSSPDCGRRALTLVPDHHICVVRESQIVAGVPDAIAVLDPRAPITFVSGPSATSDIELDRVEGVHGPRVLDVVVVADEVPVTSLDSERRLRRIGSKGLPLSA